MSVPAFSYANPSEDFDSNIPYNNRYFKNHIGEFKTEAANLANQILFESKDKEYEGPVVIRHHHYSYGPTFWTPYYFNQPRVIFADPMAVRERRRQDEKESNIALGILSTVVSFVFLYAIGSAYSRLEDASHEKGKTQVFIKQTSFDVNYVNDPKEKSLMQETLVAADLKERICKRIENSAIADLAMRITGFVGAGVLAAGAFVSFSPLVVIGTGLLVSSVGLMVLKWGINSEERHNRRDALMLQQSLQRLNQS